MKIRKRADRNTMAFVGLHIDSERAAKVLLLAKPYEGNVSMAIRALIDKAVIVELPAQDNAQTVQR